MDKLPGRIFSSSCYMSFGKGAILKGIAIANLPFPDIFPQPHKAFTLDADYLFQ